MVRCVEFRKELKDFGDYINKTSFKQVSKTKLSKIINESNISIAEIYFLT